MATKTFKTDITGLSLITTDGNGRILETDGVRALVAFDGEVKRWCEWGETGGWLICDSSAYTPEPLVFDSVAAFEAYCIECFDEAPTLTSFGSGYRDEAGNTALKDAA